MILQKSNKLSSFNTIMYESCVGCKHERHVHYRKRDGAGSCLDCEAEGRIPPCPNFIKDKRGD